MAKLTKLDRQWHELMFLCEKETSYQREGNHPKLLRLITAQIEDLAGQMGFSRRQIETREFRAERSGERIVRIATD
jgi:hypothetical protein